MQSFFQRSLVSVLTAILLLLSITATPLAALNVSEYFTISYDITFSSSEIAEGQNFSVTVTGQAICVQDLPISPTEAIITGRITAKHQNTGTTVLLNPEYTVTISPFPYSAGESGQSTQQISLQFPIGSPPGDYSISGELIQAKLRAGLLFDVTDYLPSTEPMGSITYDMLPVEPPLETPDEPEAPSGSPDPPDMPELPTQNPQTPQEPLDSNITPAFFTISDLVPPPVELKQGDSATVGVKVSNTGGQSGEYEAVFSINGTVVEIRQLALEANTNQTISFVLEDLTPGQYSFAINGLAGSFTVAKESVPLPAATPDETPEAPVKKQAGFPISTIIYILDALLVVIVVWLVLKRRRTV